MSWFNPNVDEILSTFTKTTKKLRDRAEVLKAEIQTHQNTIIEAANKKSAAVSEALRAEAFAKKLEEFLAY